MRTIPQSVQAHMARPELRFCNSLSLPVPAFAKNLFGHEPAPAASVVSTHRLLQNQVEVILPTTKLKSSMTKIQRGSKMNNLTNRNKIIWIYHNMQNIRVYAQTD